IDAFTVAWMAIPAIGAVADVTAHGQAQKDRNSTLAVQAPFTYVALGRRAAGPFGERGNDITCQIASPGAFLLAIARKAQRHAIAILIGKRDTNGIGVDIVAAAVANLGANPICRATRQQRVGLSCDANQIPVTVFIGFASLRQ